MINLMLPADIDRLRSDYRRRLIVVGSRLFWAAIIMAFVVVGAFYWLLHLKRVGLESDLASATSTETGAQYATYQRSLRDLSQKAKVLARINDQLLPSTVIRTISLARGVGVTIKNFDLHTEAGALVAVSLSGRATTRADYLRLVDSLEAIPFVAAVEAPVSNLIRERNIDFQLEMSLNKL